MGLRVLTRVHTPCNVLYMNTTAVKFNGRRAYYFSYAGRRWFPLAFAKAQLMLATGEAEDMTGKDFL